MSIFSDTALSIGFVWALTFILGMWANARDDGRQLSIGFMAAIAGIATGILLIIALMFGWIGRLI